jgi:protein TilB
MFSETKDHTCLLLEV